MTAGTALTVVQDVPVDGITETRASRTTGCPANNALDNHTRSRAKQHSDGAAQDTSLSTCHGRSDAASRSCDGANRTPVASCQAARFDVHRLASGATRRCGLHESIASFTIRSNLIHQRPPSSDRRHTNEGTTTTEHRIGTAQRRRRGIRAMVDRENRPMRC